MKKILPVLVLFSALTVSFSAAYYSIYGISRLFAGAATSIIIMISSLEFSKLVIAVLLHLYWKKLNTLLKLYLTLAIIILVIITSTGIYGFLTNAYQITANQYNIFSQEVEIIETKEEIYEIQKNEFQNEFNLINTSISDLRQSLSNPGQIQYIDRETNQVITSMSNNPALRKSLETQLDDAINRRNQITNYLQNTSDSLIQFQLSKLTLQNDSDISAELGPLIYLSELTGIEINRIVNYFSLLLVFVFDPLAISLLLSATFLFKINFQKNNENSNKNEKENIINHKEEYVDTNSNEINNTQIINGESPFDELINIIETQQAEKKK